MSRYPAVPMHDPPKDTFVTFPAPVYDPLTYVILTAARACFIVNFAFLLSLLTLTGCPHMQSIWMFDDAFTVTAVISSIAELYG